MEGAATKIGEYLSLSLQKASNPDIAKKIAKEVGYNDEPLFGKEKKRIKLLSELVMVNAGVVIFSVNQVNMEVKAKTIIDEFLSFANRYTFSLFEKHDLGFKGTYELRMKEYFSIFLGHKSVPPISPDFLKKHGLRTPDEKGRMLLALSSTFMTNIGLKPEKNPNGQILMAGHLGDFLSSCLGIVRRGTLNPKNPLIAFEQEIEAWPAAQAKTALLLVQAIITGNSEDVERLYPDLTVSQLKTVEAVTRKMEAFAESSHDF